jgi:hypothetical protein
VGALNKNCFADCREAFMIASGDNIARNCRMLRQEN